MRRTLLAIFFLAGALQPGQAADVVKTYNYFNIGGRTLEEIEAELNRRGPQVNTTGKRHPGATRMEFTSRLGYGEEGERCRVQTAGVSVKAQVFLPRWRKQRGADQDVRLIWDTLAADIRRHEESHIIIAKNHARELEQGLKQLGPGRTCAQVAARAKALSQKVLAKHDRAQAEFDRVEGINFESRFLRLLKYRMERTQSGRQ